MTKKICENYQIETPLDMITTILPKGYIVSDVTSKISDIKKYNDGVVVTLYGYIDSFEEKAISDKLTTITAKLFKDGESIYLKWIVAKASSNKMKFALKKSAPKDTLLQVSGKITSYESGGTRYVSLKGPKIEKINKESNGTRSEGIIIPEPQYILRKNTTYFELKTAFRKLVSQISGKKINYSDFLPKELEEQFKLQDLVKSLKYLHGMMPIPVNKLNDFMAYDGFKKRIDAERIWKILISTSKRDISNEIPTINYGVDEIEIIKKVLNDLPFELTQDQKKSINGFLKLLSKESGTRSLIYGDVGSGKTLVALISMHVIASQGGQSVIITPTTILAKQHFEDAKKLFGEDMVEFISTKTKISEKRRIIKRIENGDPIMVIGGISINNISFKNLKAVFIDEEQKIGVVAKEKLFNDNPGSNLIFMTATPIPRTLASAVFTNFNIFQIQTKPKNRKSRITKIFNFEKKELDEINGRMVNENQQTLIIVPSIDCEEMVNSIEVEKKYKKLFPKSEIRLINGKMKKEEVDETIEAYMRNEFSILIATVMVDSGFSNSNIAHVFIEGADRFGISQLHQIRGRCGRGELQGFCYLVPSIDKISDSTRERLNSIVNSEDGFKLAQRDIELRGSGELDGTSQSGTDLNFIEWVDEINEMKLYIEKKR